MRVNINNNKTSYENGDLIELANFGFRMIVKIDSKDNRFALMNMNGQVATNDYESIDELLKNRTIVNHYKNKDLELKLREQE